VSFKGLNCAGEHTWSSIWIPINNIFSSSADVSDGKDVSCHQQEVTDGQLVTMSLVPDTRESDVVSECHLCCPPPLPTEKVSSVNTSWELCVSRLNWKKGKKMRYCRLFVSVPLGKGDRVGTGLRGWQGIFSRQCNICCQGKSPPWTTGENSVSREWTGKREKDSGVSMCMSVPRVKEDRVGTG